jgi:hypothetical protein
MMTKLDKILNLTHYYMVNMKDEQDVIRLALSAYFADLTDEQLTDWISEYERPQTL